MYLKKQETTIVLVSMIVSEARMFESKLMKQIPLFYLVLENTLKYHKMTLLVPYNVNNFVDRSFQNNTQTKSKVPRCFLTFIHVVFVIQIKQFIKGKAKINSFPQPYDGVHLSLI
jgi:hypothetical protein